MNVRAIDEVLQCLPQVLLSPAQHALTLPSPADGKTDPFLAMGSHLSHQGLFLFTCPSPSLPPLPARQIQCLKITLNSESSSPQLTHGEGGLGQCVPTTVLDPVKPQSLSNGSGLTVGDKANILGSVTIFSNRNTQGEISDEPTPCARREASRVPTLFWRLEVECSLPPVSGLCLCEIGQFTLPL